MNIFNEAIEAHAEWKLNLIRNVEAGVLQSIKEVENCHACELGRWIYGEGSRYNPLPSFNALCSSHEQFHRAAAEIVHYCNAGETAKAKSLLKPEGLLHQSSSKLVKALMDCSKELAGSVVKGFRSTGKVSDLLKSKADNQVVSIDSTKSVKDAIKLMVEKNIGSLAVYQGRELLGIFTERGYMQNIAHKGVTSLETPVSDLIDAHTIFVDPDDSVEQCMVLMTSTHTRHLPVMQEGQLTGMISIGDVIKRVISDDEYKVTQLEGYIRGHYGAKH